MTPKIFVDMDGVLADFDKHHETVFGVRPDKVKDNVDWEKVRAVGGFYAGIPPMADIKELWDYIAPFKPIVLTGVPKLIKEEATANKRAWVRKNLGNVTTICCASKDKSLYATAGDILIDDWDKYRKLWIARGGRWITHTSAADTVAKLKELLG